MLSEDYKNTKKKTRPTRSLVTSFHQWEKDEHVKDKFVCKRCSLIKCRSPDKDINGGHPFVWKRTESSREMRSKPTCGTFAINQ